MRLTAVEADRGKRLDAFIHERLPEFSRSRIQNWIKDGLVLVGGKTEKPSCALRGGEEVDVEPAPPAPLHATPEDIPLSILYEDASVVVINKPAGMVVHAGAGITDGTLVNALLHRFGGLSAIGGEMRPGIVHRLDRFTSGALVVAKNDAAHQDLALQFSSRKVEKVYLTLVEGSMRGAGRIEKPITRDPRNRARMTAKLETGRASKTDWESIEYFDGFTFLRIQLGTGRTHQIRAHMASMGHPVAGDPLYGAQKSPWDRYFLHAHRLGFRSPATGDQVVVIAPLAPELEEWKATLAPTLR